MHISCCDMIYRHDTYTVGMYSPGKALVVYEIRRQVLPTALDRKEQVSTISRWWQGPLGMPWLPSKALADEVEKERQQWFANRFVPTTLHKPLFPGATTTRVEKERIRQLTHRRQQRIWWTAWLVFNLVLQGEEEELVAYRGFGFCVTPLCRTVTYPPNDCLQLRTKANKCSSLFLACEDQTDVVHLFLLFLVWISITCTFWHCLGTLY